MAKLELVGTYEIENLFGIPRYKVFRLLDRGLFPKPLAELQCGSVWDKTKVSAAVSKLKANRQI